MQLSKNFKLYELTRSEICLQQNIDNEPSKEEIANLKRLAETILQPLRDHLGVPITITSGFRNKFANDAVGGSKTSQHMKGQAADIRVANMEVSDLVQTIKDLDLPYHQLINEFDSWVHVSIASNGGKPKKQILHFKG